jgi:uncharacterized membrane protein YesL
MRLRISHDTLSTVLGAVHLGLMTNLLLIAGTAPFVALLVTTDLTRSWPLLVALAPLAFPALVASASAFGDSTDGVVRTWFRAWRRSFVKGLGLGAGVVALVTVLAVDVRYVFGSRAGAVLIPVLVVLIALVAGTAVHAVVALAEVPDARLRDLLRWSAYLGVRRWYLSVVSLGVLALLALFVLSRPALGLGVAAAPLLYAVWGNTRFALRPAFGAPSVPGTPAVAVA